MKHYYKPMQGPGVIVEVTPQSAGWRYLSFRVIALTASETFREDTGGTEAALVPLSGQGVFEASAEHFELSRQNLFAELPHVLYVPPQKQITVTAKSDLQFAIGGAPAEGKYPVRLFRPDEMKQEVRGGGPALRQVNHILAHPLPAERLILYEVYVPGGMWSGWPPHRHDGATGSPYLEETYYYRIDPDNGFGIQRNYTNEGDFDELFAIKNGDTAIVTRGFHPVAAAPGSNIYFLNYQAGDLLGPARATPPYDDPAHVWIKDNWDKNRLQLPIGGK